MNQTLKAFKSYMPSKSMLTAKDIARFFDIKDRRTITQMFKTGQIEAIKVPAHEKGEWRASREAVEEYIKEQTIYKY